MRLTELFNTTLPVKFARIGKTNTVASFEYKGTEFTVEFLVPQGGRNTVNVMFGIDDGGSEYSDAYFDRPNKQLGFVVLGTMMKIVNQYLETNPRVMRLRFETEKGPHDGSDLGAIYMKLLAKHLDKSKYDVSVDKFDGWPKDSKDSNPEITQFEISRKLV